MDFQERLQKAIQRGHESRDAKDRAEAEKTLSEEELRNRHSSTRLNLCDHIEVSLKQLNDHFPGFRFETILADGGWGARISRDDLRLRGGQRANQYSRFEMLVRPYSEQTKIVEIVCKGTINNKEAMNRTHYQFITEVNEDGLREMLDMWSLEFAESFSAAR